MGYSVGQEYKRPPMRRIPWLLLAAVLLPAVTFAEDMRIDGLEVRLWARATLPGMQTAAVYGVLHNLSGSPLTARSPGSDLAEHSSLHETYQDLENGIQRMQAVEELTIPPGGKVTLAPGGLHMMLMGLRSALHQGGILPISLEVQGNPEFSRCSTWRCRFWMWER